MRDLTARRERRARGARGRETMRPSSAEDLPRDALLAVDNDGALVTLDAKTGTVTESTDVPDLLEAVTVSDGYAFVASRRGIFVQKMPACRANSSNR
jgi:hypothetical protein